MKKFISMVLALTLCLAMAAPAFAAGYEPQTITRSDYGVVNFEAGVIVEKTIFLESPFMEDEDEAPEPWDVILLLLKPGSNMTVTLNDGVDFFPARGAYHAPGKADEPYVPIVGVFTDIAYGFKESCTKNVDEWLEKMYNEDVAVMIDSTDDGKAIIVQLDTNGIGASSTPTTPTQPQQPAAGGFTDVASSDYFAVPVVWAVNNKITSGTSETTFSPNDTCTQAQILTFLWRATGSPEPAGTMQAEGFDGTEYYYQAALWAAERGMISDGNFDPNALCTRAMAVTYMWNYAGSPAAGSSAFADVDAGAAYAQAVAWAVSNSVTSGTSDTTFSPSQTCTRAQIVTFLYRAFAN